MISSKIIANGILRAVTTLVFIALFIYFIYQIQSVLIYLIIALILTLIGNRFVNFFKNRLKFNHLFATISTLFLFISSIIGFLSLFIPLFLSQSQNLSLLNTASIEQNITLLINEIIVFLEDHHIDSSRILKEANIGAKINFAFIPNLLNALLGTISSFGIGLAAVFFITFFFLKDRLRFVVLAKELIPNHHEEQILNSLKKINSLLSRYFIGLLLQLGIICILYLIVLSIFSIPNAFIIAFLCAILNIIPYIGPLIASVLVAILTMISFIGNDFQTVILPTTLYILVSFWIIQLIDNNVSQPIIFSKSVSSHPLEIFLVILVAGFLFGILGMIVAIPLYTIIKVIAKEFFPNNMVIQLLTKNI